MYGGWTQISFPFNVNFSDLVLTLKCRRLSSKVRARHRCMFEPESTCIISSTFWDSKTDGWEYQWVSHEYPPHPLGLIPGKCSRCPNLLLSKSKCLQIEFSRMQAKSMKVDKCGQTECEQGCIQRQPARRDVVVFAVTGLNRKYGLELRNMNTRDCFATSTIDVKENRDLIPQHAVHILVVYPTFLILQLATASRRR